LMPSPGLKSSGSACSKLAPWISILLAQARRSLLLWMVRLRLRSYMVDFASKGLKLILCLALCPK